jgi:hypothetical protein
MVGGPCKDQGYQLLDPFESPDRNNSPTSYTAGERFRRAGCCCCASASSARRRAFLAHVPPAPGVSLAGRPGPLPRNTPATPRRQENRAAKRALVRRPRNSPRNCPGPPFSGSPTSASAVLMRLGRELCWCALRFRRLGGFGSLGQVGGGGSFLSAHGEARPLGP